MSDSDQTRDGVTVSRRLLLTTGATVVAGGLAGCSSGTGTDTETTTTTEATTEATTTEATTTTADEPAVDEAVDPVPKDSSCAVCNMMPAKYPDWNAQLTHENGDRAYFCSPGCLTAYAATPGHFADGHSTDDIAHAWARDAETGALLDAAAAQWVLERKGDRVDAPMMRNPLPFATIEGASGYVDQYDDRTVHDIVAFSAFDLPLARKFRAKLLPETDDPSILDAAEVPEDESCGVCKMMPAKFPKWNAQLSTEDGERVHFCTSGCMAAYHADPGHFGDHSHDDIVGVWVHDFETTDLVDGTTASYVLETDPERVDDPMMKNPLPFALPADASAYVDQYDDLDADDVVHLEAITRDVAATYRGKFL